MCSLTKIDPMGLHWNSDNYSRNLELLACSTMEKISRQPKSPTQISWDLRRGVIAGSTMTARIKAILVLRRHRLLLNPASCMAARHCHDAYWNQWLVAKGQPEDCHKSILGFGERDEENQSKHDYTVQASLYFLQVLSLP